jgi:hypothetical protein
MKLIQSSQRPKILERKMYTKKPPTRGKKARAYLTLPIESVKKTSMRLTISIPILRIRGKALVLIAAKRKATNTKRIAIKNHIERTVLDIGIHATERP